MRVLGREAVIDGEWATSVAQLFGDLPAQLQQQLRNTISLSLQDFTPFSGVRIGGDHGGGRGQFEEFRKTELNKDGISLEAYVQRLLTQVVPHCVNMNSARCLGHMTGGVPPFVRLLGELVLALNQNMVKQEASGSFTWLERQTLAILHRLVFDEAEPFYCEHAQAPASTLGLMAADGTIANITALWIARNRALAPNNGCGEPESDGLLAAMKHHGYRGAVIIGSRLMHYSIEKAGSLLGLGSRNVLKIDVDGRGKLNTQLLRRTIADCAAQRRRVLAIVGTAGTTDCGRIDPLQEMAGIARKSGIHFHVDAAWGTPLLFSERHRPLLAGIEEADSVSLDGHKQLHLPPGANALLLRDPKAAQVIEKEANYMLHRASGDLGKRSLEGSRGAMALFLHAALNIIGPSGYGALIDRSIAMVHALAEQLSESEEFELLVEPETNVVLYRYLPLPCRSVYLNGGLSQSELRRVNLCNERLQQRQSEAGRTLVSRTTLSNRPHDSAPAVALRAMITNPFTELRDLDAMLKEQIEIGDYIWQGMGPLETDRRM
jgi:glutamate decarboxylase